MYSWFGSARFDTPNVDMKFHRNIDEANYAILNNLPDPNQGFQDSSIGSNVFDAVEKFFSNDKAPVCGSRILILLKRYPNEADISLLVSIIRSHHAIVHVITSATPSGGSQPKTMYSVASKTNGMGPFETDDIFSYIILRFPLYETTYPIYATIIQVSGSGTEALPDFYSPVSRSYFVVITCQDHVPITSFQNLTLRYRTQENPGASGYFRVDSNNVKGNYAWGFAFFYGNKSGSIATYDTSCYAGDNSSTVLFAYSNDLSPKTVLDTWYEFTTYQNFFSWFGSVRFDTENINIHFDTNYKDVNSTIANNLPNPDQGFQDSSIGSNVFDVIEKFFSNTEAPVCGCRIVILLKRYPNEADISRIVSLIRSHHAIVHVLTSAIPSGGSQPKTMYSVASKTNGMGAFEYDENFNLVISYLPLYGFTWPIYATTIQVSGSGTKILPDFYPSIPSYYIISITYQDHVPDNSFQNLDLRWAEPEDSGNYTVDSSDVSDYWYGGTYVVRWNYFVPVNHSMTLDYIYLNQDVQNLQIRIYSNNPPNNWLPYSD
ncbi:unnamed protein product [Caenorhabditis nigoni]